ncbi:MAG TPA: GNAT family N-acetyltransferase [Desulfotomaculum sp.]|nr:GNAT family N-acetyltransferase [Desulfotomaculum sp.]
MRGAKAVREEHSYLVNLADGQDLAAAKAIADCYKNELGFVRRATLEKAISQGRMIVARKREDRSILGFVHFCCTRQGHVSIYEIAVHPNWRGRGLGRILVDAVTNEARKEKIEALRLKCPVDLPANGFYARLGFVRTMVEDGKHRALAVWEKRLPLLKEHGRPCFFVSLTSEAPKIRRVVRLWDASGDPRDPFRHMVFTPLFSTNAAAKLICRLKEERDGVVMFDSGGYHVQMGKTSYEELFDRLLRFYRENDWADWYVLPDHVPRSADSDQEVEFKVRETIGFARLFVRMMPGKFVEKAIGVIHGRTEEQIHRCISEYTRMGIGYVAFGSFGTSGPGGSVNMVSQKSLGLLGMAQGVAHEYGLRLHVFGIGSPNYLTRLAEANIVPDSFDSAGWWKGGGFGYVFTSTRSLRVCYTRRINSTLSRVANCLAADGHSCQFCRELFWLRDSRLHRVMHNLVVTMECVEKLQREG